MCQTRLGSKLVFGPTFLITIVCNTIQYRNHGITNFLYKISLILDDNALQISKSALRILESYPTIRLFPSYVIKEFPEQMDKLLQLYTFIGVNIVEEDIDKALNNLVEKMPHDTDEQTMRIKEILDNVQKLVNIQGNTAVEKMNRILEIQSRTFQGIVFQTQEERKKAEEDYIA